MRLSMGEIREPEMRRGIARVRALSAGRGQRCGCDLSGAATELGKGRGVFNAGQKTVMEMGIRAAVLHGSLIHGDKLAWKKNQKVESSLKRSSTHGHAPWLDKFAKRVSQSSTAFTSK